MKGKLTSPSIQKKKNKNKGKLAFLFCLEMKFKTVMRNYGLGHKC